MRARSLLTIAVCLGLLSAVPTAAARPVTRFFLSPSGNIGCAMSNDDGVRCDIRAHSFDTTTPRRCHLDYGDSVEVDRHGRGYLVCHGDTVLGHYPSLAYGRSLRVGTYTCSSATAGITCQNTATRHGFFLSRGALRLF